jgi:hypothetical protein
LWYDEHHRWRFSACIKKGTLGGRPAFQPTQHQRTAVAELKGFGLRHEDIRQLIINPTTGAPINHETLEQHFRRELDDGAIKANAAVVRSLYMQATGGGDWRKANVTAGIWWTKCRMRWREAPRALEHSGPSGSPIRMIKVRWDDGPEPEDRGP